MHIVVILGISKALKNNKNKDINPYYHSYSRLMKGYDVYNNLLTEDKMIICSGGFGQAEKMKIFLISKGIPEYKIIEENRSRTTIENCVYSYERINQMNMNNLVIHLVTNDYHIERSLYIFEFFTYKLLISPIIYTYTGSILEYIPDTTSEDEKEVEEARLRDIENMKNTPSRLRMLKEAQK